MVLKDLCTLRGVSGDEKRVRNYIIEHAKKYATSVTVDRMGNVLAYKKGSKEGYPHTLLCAHMDEVGMIVVGINENGLLSYATCGGIDPRVVVSKPVLIGDNEVPGVIGAKAIHLQSADERQKVLGHTDLYIDIGAKDKAEAEKLVKPGDYISFKSDWVEFGKGLVKSKALDDRVGCNTMLSILEGEYPGDVTCAFAVMEEVGLRGGKTAGYNVEADCSITLEGTTSNDLGDVPEHLRVCCVGGGVAISFMDTASIGHRGMVNALRDLADEQNISWQVKNYVAGGNDAGAIQTARAGIPVAVLSVPCRYIHSSSSVCAFADVEAQFLLTEAFLKNGARF